LKNKVGIIDLCAEHTGIFSSKGEMRRLMQGGGVSVNKLKVQDPETMIDETYLLNDKYILVQKGKKNYYVIKAV
ncbi:MAG: S4 domain-containing protein, partial [Bacteroidales bacterium]